MQTNVNVILFVCISTVISENGSSTLLIDVGWNQTEWFHWFAKAVDEDVYVTDISGQRGFSASTNDDRDLTTWQLLNKYGVETQQHYITTEDGYRLKLVQIPGSGPTVFLMPGLLGSSDDFVASGPDKALAYVLANASYDVWLGNPRGSKYSRKHEFLDPQDREFWQFCWHEIGVYDLPTMIDHALLVSNKTQLIYIGHGQGTTAFFVLNSERPEYNQKFSLMFSLGTIAWTWHTTSILVRSLIPLRDQYTALNNLGLYEIFPANWFNKFITSRICTRNRASLFVCITALFNIFGYDYSQIDYEQLPVQLSHFPSGASLKQLVHYLQLADSRTFSQFDYGAEENEKEYGSEIPPEYDVESISAPIAIFYGEKDWLSSFDDTSILIQRLPNVVDVIRVPHTRFNHYDFVWAKDIDLLVYWKIQDMIEENECCASAARCIAIRGSLSRPDSNLTNDDGNKVSSSAQRCYRIN